MSAQSFESKVQLWCRMQTPVFLEFNAEGERKGARTEEQPIDHNSDQADAAQKCAAVPEFPAPMPNEKRAYDSTLLRHKGEEYSFEEARALWLLLRCQRPRQLEASSSSDHDPTAVKLEVKARALREVTSTATDDSLTSSTEAMRAQVQKAPLDASRDDTPNFFSVETTPRRPPRPARDTTRETPSSLGSMASASKPVYGVSPAALDRTAASENSLTSPAPSSFAASPTICTRQAMDEVFLMYKSALDDEDAQPAAAAAPPRRSMLARRPESDDATDDDRENQPPAGAAARSVRSDLTDPRVQARALQPLNLGHNVLLPTSCPA